MPYVWRISGSVHPWLWFCIVTKLWFCMIVENEASGFAHNILHCPYILPSSARLSLGFIPSFSQPASQRTGKVLLSLQLRTACNATLPAKSKIAARGCKNGQRGLINPRLLVAPNNFRFIGFLIQAPERWHLQCRCSCQYFWQWFLELPQWL